MTTEEKTIRNYRLYLKQRKRRMAVIVLLLLFVLAYAGFMLHLRCLIDAEYTPERIEAMASFKYPEIALPILFSSFYKAVHVLDMALLGLITAAYCAGLSIHVLIIEIRGGNGGIALTVSMYDRIEALEKELRELKGEGESGRPERA